MMKTILVVDDEKNIRDVYTRLLQRNGYNALAAASAVAAKQMLLREKIDLVLLDINMAEVDGAELFETIAAFHKHAKVIVKERCVMKKQMIVVGLACAIVFGLLLADGQSYAQDNTQDLKNQIEALQKRVEELEAAQAQSADTAVARRRQPMAGHYRNDWAPMEEIIRMQEEMSKMFQGWGRQAMPHAGMLKSDMFYDADYNVEKTKDGYVVKFDIAGLDKDKIDIEISRHSVTISGEYSAKEEEKKPGGYVVSRSYGSFMKTIPLPADADTTNISTTKDKDTLIIRIPRKKSSPNIIF